jgi:polysaccharide pyruvyl transferase WcaK-like protein
MIDTYVEAIAQADLFVVSGAGAVVDEFAPLALTVLEQIETVRRRHARVAMMGQGLGPIDDVQLRRRCAHVLPQLDVLGLREGHTGPALLGSLGVVGPTIEMTGDDAVALAARTRAQELGRALGVNLRRARYARVGDAAQRLVRDALADFVQWRQVPLEPLPISFVAKEDDLSSIAAVLPRGYGCNTSRAWVPPSVMAERVARCRVVLTGSYHAAVFALAQGIPVVGLSASPYYDQKFSGLKDLYGAACQKFDVRSGVDGATPRLVEALVEAWEHAPELRNPALEVSDDLAESSRRLYSTLIPIAES